MLNNEAKLQNNAEKKKKGKSYFFSTQNKI